MTGRMFGSRSRGYVDGMSQQGDNLTADERTEADRQAVAEVIEKAHIAVVTTVGDAGALVSRPLGVQGRDFDGDLYFLVPDSSDLAGQVRQNPAVNVAIESHGNYLSVAGSGSISQDQALIDKFWNVHAEAWFDEGRDDSGVALLKVDAQSAELQSTDGPRPLALVKYAKAVVAEEQPDVGDTTRVEF